MPVLGENYKMRPKHNWYSKIIRKYYKIRIKNLMPQNPIPDAQILAKAEKEKKLVIQVANGGLGDHLLYSSLPELLWKQKGIKTFISNKSVFRSQVIFDFVWQLNPYVTFTDETGWYTYKALDHNFPTLDEYFQKLFGLTGDGHPKVYYKPNPIEQLKGKTIVDPSFGPSGKANGYFDTDFYRRFIEYLKSHVGEFVLITHQHSGTKNDFQELIIKEFRPECYSVSTIEEFSDVLYSAKERYLLHSGGASLVAALRLESNILNYIKPSTYDSFKYYVNNYIDLI